MKNKILIVLLATLICFAPQLQAKSSLGKYVAIAAGAALVGAVIADQCDNDIVVTHHYCFVCGSRLASHEVGYWGCRGNYIYPTYCPHNVIVQPVARPVVRPIVINTHRPKREVIIKYKEPKKHHAKPNRPKPKKDRKRNGKRR